MAKYGGELRELFDARVKQYLTATHCDTQVASASLERLAKCVTAAAQGTLCVKQHQTLRKRCVSNRTRQLYEQRRSDFAKLSEDGRRVAKRAISASCREDYREHANGILNDMDAAERSGNSRDASGRQHSRCVNHPKTSMATRLSHRTNSCKNGPSFLARSSLVQMPTRTARWNA